MNSAEQTKSLESVLNFLGPEPFALDFTPAPEVLYHYTTFAGLTGILASNRIWATNARYLNDTTEARQLWIVLERRLKAVLASGKRFRSINLEILISEVQKHVDDDFFVASFSEARDSLSQWRAYSGGGPGICIGFTGGALKTAWIHNPSGESHWTGMQFQKAIYADESDARLDTAIEGLLSGERSPLMKAAQSQLPREREIVVLLSLLHARFKHIAFREEQEWRLSFKRYRNPMRHQKFRSGRAMLIPYIEAELNKSLEKKQIVEGEYIHEVIVGPSAHAELNKQAVEQFLHSLGRDKIPVVISSTPYRDW